MDYTIDLIRNMQEFTDSYKGKKFYFNNLSENEKYTYVLVDSFCYFSRFLNYKNTMDRCIANAESHKKDNYSFFKDKECYLED